MAEITPQLVKNLREKTGAGMGECKKALVEANGDMEQAIDILRKKGAASAAKRADRTANEGLIIAKTNADNKLAIMVEINCETDFVARNEGFIDYANKVADALLANQATSIEEVLALKVDDDTIAGLHNEILAKFSEKIEIRRFVKMATNGFIIEYIHAGSKLAVLVECNAENLNDTAKQLLRDIAMQIAAMNPQFVDRKDVDAATLQKEKEIYKQMAIDSGKPADIAERIAEGKLDKFFQEQCLLEQSFVKDGNKSVAEVMKEVSSINGSEVNIIGFRRYSLGEN